MVNTRSFAAGLMVLPLVLVAVAGVFGATATVPNTFVSGTVADASQVNANFIALRDAINSNIEKRTVLQVGGQASDATITSTYELLRSFGSFTKNRADTDIIVSVRDHVRMVGAVDQFLELQIRIDGVEATGNFTGAVCYMDAATGHEHFNTFERFTGLAVGLHTVELWIRGSCTSITENFGNFQVAALVEEGFSN